mmetsp:Transcript_5279/g.9692  ORF Transcript_5279/g.9692 Transcript_5279/m.9692 type:complete len:421 (+) Transcript_5279:367-1629(+)
MCKDCHSSCEACTGPSSSECTRCTENMNLNAGKCVCNDGFYLDGQICKPCHSSCATCDGDGFQKCLTCTNNYYAETSRLCSGNCKNVECLCAKGCYSEMLDSTSQCYSECDSCKAADCKCKDCGRGQFINGCYCYPCPQGCETCNSYTENGCTSCFSGYSPSRSQDTFECISDECDSSSSCPQNTYFDKEECDCIECDFTCSDCLGPSNYECRMCSSNSFVTSQVSGLVEHCRCNADCESDMIDDGTCDSVCNFEACGLDGGDCDDSSSDDSGLSDKVIIIIATVVGGVVFIWVLVVTSCCIYHKKKSYSRHNLDEMGNRMSSHVVHDNSIENNPVARFPLTVLELDRVFNRTPYSKDIDLRSIGTCDICLNDFRAGIAVRVLRCQDIYHVECIDEWFLSQQERVRDPHTITCPRRHNPF